MFFKKIIITVLLISVSLNIKSMQHEQKVDVQSLSNSEMLESELLPLVIIKKDFNKAEKLIKNGANINAPFQNLNDNHPELFGLSPLIIALNNRSSDIVAELLKRGANSNIIFNDEIPLLIAARNGDLESFKNLAFIGRSSYHKNKHDETALIIAASNGHENIVEFLTHSRNLNLNEVDNRGNSALFYAAWYGYPKIVKILLDHNVEVDIKNKNSVTPLFAAVYNFQRKKAQDYLNIINQLLHAGADVNIQDKNNNSPLLIAVAMSNKTLVELLLRNDADSFLMNKHNISPIIKSFDNPEILKLIIDFANIGINEPIDDKGNPLLFYAVREGKIEAIKFLVQHGADINYVNNYGNQTALHYLANYFDGEIKNFPATAKLLLDLGIDPYAKDQNGDMAIEILTDKVGVDDISKEILIHPNVDVNRILDSLNPNVNTEYESEYIEGILNKIIREKTKGKNILDYIRERKTGGLFQRSRNLKKV